MVSIIGKGFERYKPPSCDCSECSRLAFEVTEIPHIFLSIQPGKRTIKINSVFDGVKTRKFLSFPPLFASFAYMRNSEDREYWFHSSFRVLAITENKLKPLRVMPLPNTYISGLVCMGPQSIRESSLTNVARGLVSLFFESEFNDYHAEFLDEQGKVIRIDDKSPIDILHKPCQNAESYRLSDIFNFDEDRSHIADRYRFLI